MNTVASSNLATQCRERGIRRYIFASTCSVYDTASTRTSVLQDEGSELQPRGAYAGSKYEAERRLLQMADGSFCAVILRKGTIFGFFPRMRYDLVVNTFVRDVLTSRYITLHYGAEMWRPARGRPRCCAGVHRLSHRR
jgi:nucleoside-diphosphate-sugar epimerase